MRGRVSHFKGLSRPEIAGKNHPNYKGGEIHKICSICSTTFTVKRYRATTASFCSQVCKKKGQDRGISSENEKQRKGNRYKEWRKSVFQRDNFCCQQCGQVGGKLNADHILPFAFFKEVRFDVDNGRTLCRSCHLKTETFGRKAMKFSTVTKGF
jgi:5-methylcytosine-specific restriction endonuclease McrA